MRLLAIDPGPTESAWVLWDGHGVMFFSKQDNETVRTWIRQGAGGADRCAIEMIASYGMPVGAETFETCVWIGRFIESSGPDACGLVYRLDVKKAICHHGGATDANIRQALIDRFGGKDKAVGLKKTPGPLYGMSGDCWAALGVWCTFWDKQHVGSLLKGA